jgi:hypothetical protein
MSKPLDQFHRNRSTPSGYSYWCKECHRAGERKRAAIWAQEAPETEDIPEPLDWLRCAECGAYADEPYGRIVQGRRLCVRCGGDDRRPPSEVMDEYWIYARRRSADYPPHTERGGKWLLFIPKEHIDEAWATIKEATEDGRLGSSAKVATACPNPHETNPGSKVICVYTYDGDDRDDVGRVPGDLRALGFWAAESPPCTRPIWPSRSVSLSLALRRHSS